MFSIDSSVRTNKDAGAAVKQGTREVLQDAADRGFNVSQERVPHGATSNLANTAVEPFETDDGAWVWGYPAEYALDVEEGTAPHLVPIDDLRKWARRVLGDEAAAGAVWRKIAREGTEAQPYVEPGVDAMKAYLRGRGLKAAISDNL